MIIVLAVVILFGSALALRAIWINEKLATLTSPASTAYASSNKALPPKGSRARIVLAGDSRMQRWAAASWPTQFEVINRGIGGETAVQLSKRFAADAIALDPDVIVVGAGMNDLVAASLMDEEQKRLATRNTSEKLRQIATEGAAAGRRVMISTIIPPARPEFLRLPVWNESVRALVTEVNEDLKRTRWPDKVTLIDLSATLAENRDTLPDEYRLDTLHLNEAGYTRLTEALASHLQSVLDAADRPLDAYRPHGQ